MCKRTAIRHVCHPARPLAEKYDTSMKTYFIGDLQGCHAQTAELIERIQTAADGPYRLLFAGDLINRGP
ncbi:MAG: metallophosphoesterase, partial [Janthinobacterium sp.]